MHTVRAYTATLLLEPELGTWACTSFVNVLAVHQQPEYITDHHHNVDCCNQSRAQTLMLQTCRLLHTACAVSAHTHCAAKQNRDPSRLQNCSQHLSLLHILAEQNPLHAAAEIPGSGSGSVVSLGRRIWTCPHLSNLSSMKHCSCFCIRHSQGQLLLLI